MATEILWVLMDSPRPLFLYDIVRLLDDKYPSSDVMATLVWLVSRGRVNTITMARSGKGRRIAKAYSFHHPADLLMDQP